jgi:hypothetical protein
VTGHFDSLSTVKPLSKSLPPAPDMDAFVIGRADCRSVCEAQPNRHGISPTIHFEGMTISFS